MYINDNQSRRLKLTLMGNAMGSSTCGSKPKRKSVEAIPVFVFSPGYQQEWWLIAVASLQEHCNTLGSAGTSK
jgi:hypothetical protein